MELLIGIAIYVALFVVPATICALKSKPFLALAGLITSPLAWVGAALLALPDSWWARRFYGETKLAAAHYRFEPELPCESDGELLDAWEGVAIDRSQLDRTTRRALRRAGRI